MRSVVAVISWWSNCLALACLHALVRLAPGREVVAIQVGKPEEQKQQFRAHLPPGVGELPYPSEQPAEDWRVREAVARSLSAQCEGVWLFDHDLFLQAPAGGWLDAMDRRLERSDVCLAHPAPLRGPSITSPAFWLSPRRFPPGMPGFARLPRRDDPAAARPWQAGDCPPAELVAPAQDTLVAAAEFLRGRSQVLRFPLSEADRQPGGPEPFPRHEHLGGLSLFAAPALPEPLRGTAAAVARRLAAFYAACPEAWVQGEEPVLLRRVRGLSGPAAGRGGGG